MSKDKAGGAAMADPDSPAPDDQARQFAALKEENQFLQQLAEYSSRAISRAAHELRTPLTSILGFVEILLSQEQLSLQQRNFCERIQNSGRQLQNSVNQLSEVAHIDVSKSPLRFDEFALDDILAEVANSSTTQTRKKGIVIDLQAAAESPLIASDRAKLRQGLRVVFDYVFSQIEAGGSITVKTQHNKTACSVAITGEKTLDNLNPTQTNDRDLVLAVARHTLSSLGATLSTAGAEHGVLKVLIELPIDIQ